MLFKGGVGTVYRTNILITGSQLDAGMDNPLSLDPTGVAWTRIALFGNNLGGSVTMSAIAPLQDSEIRDQLVSEWKAGTRKSTNATGSQSIPLFSVAQADSYGGTKCDLTVCGLVAGVGGGITVGTFVITMAAGTPTVTQISQTQTPSTSGFFSITSSVSGDVVTFWRH